MIQRKAGDPESMVIKTIMGKKKWTVQEVKDLCTSAGVEYRPGDENHIVRYIASSQAVDRESDVMVMAGGEFTQFKTNPVFIWAHDLYEVPLGTVINIEVQGDKLIADVLYHCITEVSQDICAMALAGHIKAVSIGFRGLPGGVKFPNEQERQALGMRPGGLIFERWELHELSQCPVGMNQEALQVRALNKKTIALLKGEDPTTNLEEEDINMKPDEITKTVSDAITAAMPALGTSIADAISKAMTPAVVAPVVPPAAPVVPEANKTLAALLASQRIAGPAPVSPMDRLANRFTSEKVAG